MPPSESPPAEPAAAYAFGPFAPALEYVVDAAQRSLLVLDVMRQSGNQYREHLAETAPHVLDYEAELVVDGRTLARPVNYALVRIVPPKGVTVRPGIVSGTWNGPAFRSGHKLARRAGPVPRRVDTRM